MTYPPPTSDVIVVGAGPAGSVASAALAIRGYNVLLLEAKNTIGLPVRCGELLRPANVRDLELRSLINPTFEIPECEITGPYDSSIRFVTPDPAVIIRRDEFDLSLAVRAQHAGVHVKTGHYVGAVQLKHDCVRVFAHTDAGIAVFTAKALIAADGVSGRIGVIARIARALRPAEVAVTASVKLLLSRDSGVAKIVLHPELAPGGYIWEFPIGNGVWNIGLGTNPVLAKGKSAKQRLISYLQQHQLSVQGPITLGGIPAGSNSVRPLEQIASIGDAARLPSATTGAGICLAVNSGLEVGSSLFKKSCSTQVNKFCVKTARDIRALLNQATMRQTDEAIRALASQPLTPMSVSAAFEKIAQEIAS